MLGRELVHDQSLSRLERLYIRILGVPISGLRNRARRVLPLVGTDHKKVLDAGCGQGVFTFEIARRLPDAEVVGVDVDEALIERNRRIADDCGLRNCRFEVRDVTGLDIESEYDLVLCVDLLEHIANDDEALSNMHAALKPGGRLILHVPGRWRRWILLGWRENFQIEGHKRSGYSLEEIRGKVENAGFKVLDCHYTYGWLETVTNNFSYLLTGSRMKHRFLYAILFPFLLFFSYFGRNSKPARGAGVLVFAEKQRRPACDR
jgi:SAM-dependent methyltransferase